MTLIVWHMAVVLLAAPTPREQVVVVTHTNGAIAESEKRTQVQFVDALRVVGIDAVPLSDHYADETQDDTGRKLIDRGREAYEALDFDDATTQFHDALIYFEAHPESAHSRWLADASFYLSLVSLQLGKSSTIPTAEVDFQNALIHNPNLTIDRKTYGAAIKKVFDRARKAVAARALGSIQVDSIPAGVNVTLRDQKLGVTPIDESISIPVGRHLLQFSKMGFKTAGVIVNVAKGQNLVRPILTKAEAFQQISSMFQTIGDRLNAPAVPPELVPEMQRLGARFWIVMNDTPVRTEISVWDHVANRHLAAGAMNAETDAHVIATAIQNFIREPMKPLPQPLVAVAPQARLYRKWWFWAAAGVVVAGAATAATIGIVNAQPSLPVPLTH